MILTEAYDYMDLLLDKADQPYFITEEKNKFLNIAISDFINFHYQKMTIDEDSRRALAGCIDFQDFELTDAHILGMSILDDIYGFEIRERLSTAGPRPTRFATLQKNYKEFF